jgi:hypothetical protein
VSTVPEGLFLHIYLSKVESDDHAGKNGVGKPLLPPEDLRKSDMGHVLPHELEHELLCDRARRTKITCPPLVIFLLALGAPCLGPLASSLPRLLDFGLLEVDFIVVLSNHMLNSGGE